jgi:hypothetical protein
VLVLEGLEVVRSRFCGQVLGERSVPKGPSNRSLAVYCQGMQGNRTRPVGNGMIG